MSEIIRFNKIITLLVVWCLILVEPSFGIDKSVKIIGADLINKFGIDGSNNTVCLIDTGVDYRHENIGNCNDINNCGRVLGGYNFHDENNDPVDISGHGTEVAGIIMSNNSKFKGVSPGAKLVILKALNSTGGSWGSLNRSVAWCVDNSTRYGITLVSMSLGDADPHTDATCTDFADIQNKVNEGVQKGIAFIAASGNEGSVTGINYPACLPNVTSVGSINNDDEVAKHSNRYSNLDLLAPGIGIKSTKMGGGLSAGLLKDFICDFSDPVQGDIWTYCDDMAGTSFATPHVAGSFALIKQYDSALKPRDIERLLKDTGKNISDSVSGFSFKRIDLLSALNVLDWPTDHHDFRRTGFTLLKGDVNKASDIDASNVALKQNIQSDILIRPSISDIDGNGHQEVVTVMYELGAGNSNGSEVHAVERQNLLFGKWLPKTKERWKEVVPVSYPLLPPTLANIDTDTSKEVLVGLENGTLLAYDITSGGQDQDAVEKWRYKFAAKYSAQAGTTFVRFGGGTAVGDIDLDGNQEILTADMGNRGTPDWPGEVFIIDGTTGIKEGNATFGNGGAFASVSVANIDSDDNPEIIVPSFYGVYVYDYNSSAPNKLTLKCSTSDGMIDGSVVVYDVDRDNQYELVYTTTTLLCDQSKTCYNRLYIKNAQTCADESPSPISLSVYSRVTPAIANLDSDSNYEIVISGRLNTQDEYGKIIAYDATTGAQQWSYDDSGTLKTAFVAPDIADMNGDGRYDIVFGENNGTKVHIVNSSGGKNFTYNFNAFVDSALAIADIDGDGKAEIALKREGSPYGILAVAGSFNNPPQLGNISNVTARAGDLIDLNRSGEVRASDPEGNALTFTFSSPFNSSGKWQTTVNDTGNYSIMVEVSDGSLTDFAFVDAYVFNQTVNFVGNFSDGAASKLLNYTAAANNTISVRLPKNATIIYSRIRLEGRGS